MITNYFIFLDIENWKNVIALLTSVVVPGAMIVSTTNEK